MSSTIPRVGAFVAVAGIKGGIGKTSLAVTLAAHFARMGRRTVLLDCDPQQSASRWIHQIDPAFPAVAMARAEDMRGAVVEAARAANELGDFIVADPPPSSPEVLRTLLALCDLAVVPSGDNAEELFLAQRTIETAAVEGSIRHEPIPCLLVRTRFDRTRLSADAEEGVSGLGADVASTILRARVAWRLAMSDGVSIFDLPMSRHADAIREAAALCIEITNRVDHGREQAAEAPRREADRERGDERAEHSTE